MSRRSLRRIRDDSYSDYGRKKERAYSPPRKERKTYHYPKSKPLDKDRDEVQVEPKKVDPIPDAT